MTRRIALLVSAAALNLATAIPAAAQVPHDVARLELLTGWREADGTHVAALRIRLAPGWKTYWRSPGDGGIPPRLSLAASGNLEGASIHWPVPEVFHTYGIQSVGYTGDVVLPVVFRAADADAPIRLSGEIEIGVCEDVCIPVSFSLSGVLPPGGGNDPAIRAALADRPMTETEAGVGDVFCEIAPAPEGMELIARISMPPLGGVETAVVELPDASVWVSEADTIRDRSGQTLVAAVDMVPETGGVFMLDRSNVRITIIGDGVAVDIRGCD